MVEMYQLYREQPKLKEQAPFPIDESRYRGPRGILDRRQGPSRGPAKLRRIRPGRPPGCSTGCDRGSRGPSNPDGHGAYGALASTTDRADYRQTVRRLWENMTTRRMYVTGGVGAVAGDQEKFGDDYVFLPNNGDPQTCAAVVPAFSTTA